MEALTTRIHGRVGWIDNICEDPTCNCKQDKRMLAMRGKWVVEVNLVTPKGELLEQLAMLGPFDSEAQANAALKRAMIHVEESVSEGEFLLMDKTPNEKLH